MQCKKESAHASSGSCSDGSASRGAVTALGRHVGAAPSGPAAATVLGEGLASRQEHQRRTKDKPEDTLGQKTSELPGEIGRNLVHNGLPSNRNARFDRQHAVARLDRETGEEIPSRCVKGAKPGTTLRSMRCVAGDDFCPIPLIPYLFLTFSFPRLPGRLTPGAQAKRGRLVEGGEWLRWRYLIYYRCRHVVGCGYAHRPEVKGNS